MSPGAAVARIALTLTVRLAFAACRYASHIPSLQCTYGVQTSAVAKWVYSRDSAVRHARDTASGRAQASVYAQPRTRQPTRQHRRAASAQPAAEHRRPEGEWIYERAAEPAPVTRPHAAVPPAPASADPADGHNTLLAANLLAAEKVKHSRRGRITGFAGYRPGLQFAYGVQTGPFIMREFEEREAEREAALDRATDKHQRIALPESHEYTLRGTAISSFAGHRPGTATVVGL